MKRFRLVEARTDYWELNITARDRDHALEIWRYDKETDHMGNSLRWCYQSDRDLESTLTCVHELDAHDKIIVSHAVRSDKLAFVEEEDE